jgi:hypothetical protein
VENAVEVRYAGVVVGRGALVTELGPDAAFVGISEPLPVGTLVTLKIGDAIREAWVDEVVESSEPSAVGMRVRWGASAPAARPVSQKAEEPASTPESGPTVDVESSDEGSGALAAPGGLAGEAQPGGGKRRRKRR